MTILHVDSSVLGEHSVSRQLTQSIVDRLVATDPAASLDRLDLAVDPVDHFFPGAQSGHVERFLAADTVVIGAPMYNFAIPSQLKAWIDSILVAGRTFRYTETGPEGLAGPKRIIIAVSRGGIYSAGSPGAAAEHVETYLRAVFGFIGLVPEFVIAEGVQLGADQKQAAIAKALGDIQALAA